MILSRLVGLATPYVVPALGAALMFVALIAAGQTWRLDRAQAKLARAEVVAAAADEKFRTTERKWLDAVQEGQHAIDQAKKEFIQAKATLTAAAAADLASLRKRLAGSGQAPSSPATPSSGDAATCGDLLAEALQVAGECTAGAESHLGTARALLGAWPK